MFSKKKFEKDKTCIDSLVLWTLLSIYLSMISSIITYHQGLYDTFVQCVNLTYPILVYFVLRRWNLSEIKVVRIISIISIVWVFLELFQQISYPIFWFSGRYLFYDSIEERMGLWRFYIFGIDMVLLTFVYWYGRVLSLYQSKGKLISKALFYVIIVSVGILCYCSRKHIAVLLLVYVWSVINFKGKNKWLIILAMSLVLLFLYVKFYGSFQELNETSMEAQGEGEDFIRLLAAQHFLFDFSDSTLYRIFGCGLPAGGSALSKELEYLAKDFGYYQADCGLVGYFSQFGICGISAIVLFFYLFLKNRKFIDNWLKYFFLMKLMLLFFDFWAMWASGYAAFAVFLFFLQRNITKNKVKYNLSLINTEKKIYKRTI